MWEIMRKKIDRPLTLYELNALVKKSIRTMMPDTYWLQAELSEVRPNYSSGHCYLEFVQKELTGNGLVAKARGVIWSNTYRQIKSLFERETGQAFVSGIKVLVNVKPDFHELYGYQLTVVGIDPTYTLGDIARRRKEIMARLEADGVASLNKELEMPELPQRIAVISSQTAAGYEDFCKQLYGNSFGFVFYTRLFPAVMQGEGVEASVIEALESIYEVADRFDTVVIIRGGGPTSDLSGFDTYNLAFNCAQFPLPIITGIGHERDDTVIDMVSHTRVKTPTAAAEFLISHVYQSAQHLQEMQDYIYKVVPQMVSKEKERLEGWLIRIPSLVQMRLQSEHFRHERIAKRLEAAWRMRNEKERHRLELLEEKVKASSPELLLSRGYSITLKEGKVVTDPKQVEDGDVVVTRVAKGVFYSKVKSEE